MRLLLVGTVIMGIIMLWRYLRKTRRRKKRTTPFAIPSGVTIEPIRLLEEEEIALYSLLQMAVQERYLVFSQVPLWSFVEVDAEATVRSALLREIALKRVDFVLVHPGSCRVECGAIERQSSHLIMTNDSASSNRCSTQPGIKLTTLQPKKSHTLPDLTA